MNISREIVGSIIKIVKQECNPLFIYLFGSAVDGNFTSNSDVDIAFYSNEEISEYKCFMMGQSIASSLGREVDLVDLKTANMVLRAQIVGKGSVIFCNDENNLIEFNIKSLKEYAYLNDERKEIIDQIKERGKVYE
jgi:predicted nucleotidyltransferase